MSTSHYIPSEATRRRIRRERAAAEAARPRTAFTIREWQAMGEPDAETEPKKHRTWTMFQTYKEPPPMPSGPSPDAVLQHGSRAAALAPAAVRIVNKYSRTLSKIKRLDVPEPTRQKLRDLARQDASAALAPLHADWKTTKASVEDITRSRMAPQPMDAAGEQRISRAWARLERILDAAPESERQVLAEQHLRRAKESGDTTTMAALWESLPNYFEASERDDRGRESASKLRDVLVQLAGPEDAQRAYKEAAEFARGAARIDTSLAQADYALSGAAELEASTADSQFPGWRESELFTLEVETPDEAREDTEITLRAMLR